MKKPGHASNRGRVSPFRILLLLGVIFVSSPSASAQTATPVWQQLPGGPNAQDNDTTRHDDIVFVNERVGWIVNTIGQIWKTVDGGISWNKQLDRGLEARFRSAAFVSEMVGWVGTVLSDGRVLFETRDGGDTWTDITDRISPWDAAGICGMWAVNEQVIYGAGAFHGVPRIIKTTDGGLTWTSTRMETFAETLVDVYFVDENRGFATGGTGPALQGDAVVLSTFDGGDHWSTAYKTTREEGVRGEWGWKISFPSTNTGYVSIEYGGNPNREAAKILKTRNGGLSWFPLTINGSTEPAGLQGIGFINDNIGWATGRGMTSITTDGGSNWTQLAPYSSSTQGGQLDGNVNRFFVLSDSLAFAVGTDVFKFSSGSTSTSVAEALEIPSSFRIHQNYPNPFSPSTTISYTLLRDVPVRVVVYDPLGRHIKTLIDTHQSTGEYTLTWDGTTESGERSASGAYLYLLDIGEGLEMKHMVLLN